MTVVFLFRNHRSHEACRSSMSHGFRRLVTCLAWISDRFNGYVTWPPTTVGDEEVTNWIMTGVLCFFGLAPKKIIAWVLGFRIFGLWGWGTILEAGPNRLQKKNDIYIYFPFTKPCDIWGAMSGRQGWCFSCPYFSIFSWCDLLVLGSFWVFRGDWILSVITSHWTKGGDVFQRLPFQVVREVYKGQIIATSHDLGHKR